MNDEKRNAFGEKMFDDKEYNFHRKTLPKKSQCSGSIIGSLKTKCLNLLHPSYFNYLNPEEVYQKNKEFQDMDDIRRNRERLRTSLDKEPRSIFKCNKRKRTKMNNNNSLENSLQNQCSENQKNSEYSRKIKCQTNVAKKFECCQKISKCHSKKEHNSSHNLRIYEKEFNLTNNMSMKKLLYNDNGCLPNGNKCSNIEIICKKVSRPRSCRKSRKVISTKKKIIFNRKPTKNFKTFKDDLIRILDKKCGKKHAIVCCTNSITTPTKSELGFLIKPSLNQIEMISGCGRKKKLVLCCEQNTDGIEDVLEAQRLNACEDDCLKNHSISQSSYQRNMSLKDVEIDVKRFSEDCDDLESFTSTCIPCEDIYSTKTNKKYEENVIDENWILLKKDHCLENYSENETPLSEQCLDENPIQICTMLRKRTDNADQHLKKINTQNELIKTNYDTKIVLSEKKKRTSVVSVYSKQSITELRQSYVESRESLANSSFLSEFLERYYKLANDGICEKTCYDNESLICPTPPTSPCEDYSSEIIELAEKNCLPEHEKEKEICSKYKTASVYTQTELDKNEKMTVSTQTSPLNLSCKSINTSFVESPEICPPPYIVDENCGNIFDFPSVECIPEKDVPDSEISFDSVHDLIESNPHRSLIRSYSESNIEKKFSKLKCSYTALTPAKKNYASELIVDTPLRSPLSSMTCSTSSFSRLIHARDAAPVEFPQAATCCLKDMGSCSEKCRSNQNETMKLSCKNLSLKISLSPVNNCSKSLCCGNCKNFSKSNLHLSQFSCLNRKSSFVEVANVSLNQCHKEETIYCDEKYKTRTKKKKNCVKFRESAKD